MVGLTSPADYASGVAQTPMDTGAAGSGFLGGGVLGGGMPGGGGGFDLNTLARGLANVAQHVSANFARDPAVRQQKQQQILLQQDQQERQRQAAYQQQLDIMKEGISQLEAFSRSPDPKRAAYFQSATVKQLAQRYVQIAEMVGQGLGVPGGGAGVAQLMDQIIAAGSIPPQEEMVKVYNPQAQREEYVPRSQVGAGTAAGPSMGETTQQAIAQAGGVAGATAAAQQPYEMARIGAQGAESRRTAAYEASLKPLPGPESPQGKVLADRQRFVDQFGEGSPQVQSFDKMTQVADSQRTSNEQSLSSKYVEQSKRFVTTRDFYTKLALAANEPEPTNAGDLAIIFGYMKMQDPESAVMSGEQASAANAPGVQGWVRELYNNVVNGKRLTPQQRREFLAEAEKQFDASLKTQRGLEKEYSRIAEGEGLDPKNVVVDYTVGFDRPQKSGDGKEALPAGIPAGSTKVETRLGPAWRTPDGRLLQVQ